MGNFIAGKFLGAVFRLITLWEDRSTTDFLEATCYKIITFDPKDEVIPCLCSLMHGITFKLKENKHKLGEEKQLQRRSQYKSFNPVRLFDWLRRFTLAFKQEFYYRSLRDPKNLVENLSNKQISALFQCFNRIYSLYDSYCEGKKSSNMRRLISTGPLFMSPVSMKSVQPLQNAGDSFTEPLEIQEEIELIKTGSPRKSNPKKGSIQTQEQKPARKSILSQELNLDESLSKGSYIKLFDEEAQSSSDLLNLLGYVISDHFVSKINRFILRFHR